MVTTLITRSLMRPRVLTLGLIVLLCDPIVRAQQLNWERVGDSPISASDIVFDETEALWAKASEVFWLDEVSNSWDEVADEQGDWILVLEPDTLLISGSYVAMSTDGGDNWNSVWDKGRALFETDLNASNEGILITGVRDSSGSGYSLDRGMTWQKSTFAEPSTSLRECYAFLEMPVGHAHEGRIMAGCLGGLAYSDNGGRMWNYTNAWWTFQTQGTSLALGPDGTAYAISGDGPGPGGMFLWASSDGVTWEQRSPLPGVGFLVVLPDPAPLGSLIAIPEFEDEGPGVYGSTDGGFTFWLQGRVPEDPDAPSGTRRASDALLGPDGLLYVAATRSGPVDEWVYRTTAFVVVANEISEPPEPPTQERLAVYPNPTLDRIVVEAVGLSDAVVIYDLLGREVRGGRLVDGRGSMELSGLPAGVYIVRVGVHVQCITVL